MNEPVRTSTEEQRVQLLILSLVLGGVLIIAVAVALGLIIGPLYFGLAVFSLIDFGLAWAYATGRVGPLASVRRRAEAGEAAAAAEADPSFNPYARED